MISASSEPSVQNWGPSKWGQNLTRTLPWHLRLLSGELLLTVGGKLYRADIVEHPAYRIHSGLLWTDVTLQSVGAPPIRVDGLPNSQAKFLIAELQVVLEEKQLQRDVELVKSTYASIREWLSSASAVIRKSERHWITHESQQALHQLRPSVDSQEIRRRFENPQVHSRLEHDPISVEKALKAWDLDWTSHWKTLNERHVQRELSACKDLFDRVETKPLTEEQARAVACFDNRVLVVASAGSGKTSTMVAKAAYAIHREIVDPKRIVMLAFNKTAADELKERVTRSFERLGMTGVNVSASTFHALGLSIIGKATGEKPDVPDWAIDIAAGNKKLMDIIDQIKDRSIGFRTHWDLFRLVFGRDLPPVGSQGNPDMWDQDGNGRMLTLNGEQVRSQEEVILANWLFYNGVKYEYERAYESKTADDAHRQYKPDFYYPDIGLYHEHFALDASGNAPKNFAGYMDGVQWKRQLHATRGTALFETTSHGLRNGDDLDLLAAVLKERGIVLDPNPDREIPTGGQKPIENEELISLVRTFITHAKSNCLTVDGLRQRLSQMTDDVFKHRHRMFLNIAGPILNAWDAALISEGGIDFEDMLNVAAEHIENGRYDTPFDLVMADEYQDASRARARLCRAMVQKPGRYFFAVGDDWQSINRFAGADVSVMTGFQNWFGHGQTLKLEQTFRCPQELCDISSRFISKNPAQIPKRVRSVTSAVGPVLRALQVDHRDKLQSAIVQFLNQLRDQVRNGVIEPGRNKKVSVFILGRYRADRAFMPQNKSQFEQWLDLSFLTMHSSKGSEADYVILPSMISIARGRSFPSTRADDPVLGLAMPAGDSFPASEERRLFYVALTRARRNVTMFTVRGQRSVFLNEIVNETGLAITDTDGTAIKEKSCPVCKQGAIITRNGQYGEFESCSNFPICRYKPPKHSFGGNDQRRFAQR